MRAAEQARKTAFNDDMTAVNNTAASNTTAFNTTASNKLSIYAATAVAGQKGKREHALLIRDVARRYGTVKTEHLFEEDAMADDSRWSEEEQKRGRDGNVFERDLRWIDESDCAIVNVSPSFGMGWEAAYAAYERKIPVLLIYPKDVQSKMVFQNTHPLITHAPFENEDDIECSITRFLENIRAWKEDDQ